MGATGTNVTLTVQVKLECEACGKKYEYTKRVNYNDSRLFTNLEKSIKSAHDQLNIDKLGIKRCPECNYLQSWMQKNFKNKWDSFFMFCFGVLVVYLGARLFGWPKDIAIILHILIFIGYCILLTLGASVGYWISSKVMIPNKFWYRGDDYREYPVKEPVYIITDVFYRR